MSTLRSFCYLSSSALQKPDLGVLWVTAVTGRSSTSTSTLSVLEPGLKNLQNAIECLVRITADHLI